MTKQIKTITQIDFSKDGKTSKVVFNGGIVRGETPGVSLLIGENEDIGNIGEELLDKDKYNIMGKYSIALNFFHEESIDVMLNMLNQLKSSLIARKIASSEGKEYVDKILNDTLDDNVQYELSPIIKEHGYKDDE